MRQLFLTLVAFVLLAAPKHAWATSLFSPATPATALLATLPTGTAALSVNGVVLSQLRNRVKDGGSLRLDLMLPHGQQAQAELTRFTVISKSAQLISANASNMTRLQAPQGLLLSGRLVGDPTSHVFLAVYPTRVFGRVEARGLRYDVVMLSDQSSDGSGIAAEGGLSNSGVFALIASTNVQQPQAWNCETEEPATLRTPRSTKKSNQVQATTRTINLAMEGDYDYYEDHGKDADAATEYAEAVVAAVSDIYKRDVGASISITSWKLWTSDDPYTGTTASTILGQVRNYWKSNNASVDRSVVQVLSGINGIGGVAYIDGLCDKNNGYSVAGLNSTYTYPRTSYAWDTDVVAHELGHNVGSPHTHSCTWNPPIDSCYTAEGSCFSQTVARQGTIMSYCHLTNQGTALNFHSRVADLMKEYLEDAACLPQGLGIIANAGQDQTVCGGVTVNFEGSAVGGTEPYTVSWSPNTGMTDSTTFTPSVVAGATTVYVMTVMDADSNVATDTVVVTVNPEVVVTAPDTVNVCKGSAATITVQVSGGTGLKNYTWNVNGAETQTTVNTYTFTPTATTTVGLLVVDSKECNANVSIVVKVNPVPVLTLTGPTTMRCADDASTLKARITGGTPPYAYNWVSKDGPFSQAPDSIVVSPDSNATYWLTITDAKGCTDTASVFIQVHDVQLSLSTNHINLPKLGACQTEEDVWITVMNNGSIPLTIEGVTASRTTITSKDFPVTIQPHSSHLLPLRLGLPSVSPIQDTLYFMETICKKPVLVSLSGVRGGIEAVQNDTTVSGPRVVACSTKGSVVLGVSVTNSATKAATVTKVTSRSGASITLHNSPVVIPANGSGTLQLTRLGLVNAGNNTDTLTISYTSELCSGELVTIVRYTGDSLTLNLPLTLAFTDPVSPSLEDVTKPLAFTPEFSGVSELTVSSVTVTGPFATDLAVGTVLTSGSEHTTNVIFKPSQMQSDGDTTGVLSVYVNGCTDAHVVSLSATRTIVSVREELLRTPTCWASGGILHTHPQDVGLQVFDLSGNLVMQRLAGSTSVVLLDAISSGMYTVVLTDGEGKRTIQAIMNIR